ncbi:hypothetical protein [Kitasatospora sp. NPDC004289]
MTLLTAASRGYLPPLSFGPALGDTALVKAGDALAKDGDWRPAKDLLAAADGDWALKDHQVQYLGERKRCTRALETWAAAEPENADVWTVLAVTEVIAAWKARGARYAWAVRKKAWPVFFDRLRQADLLAGRAAGLAPHDPTPLALALLVARGLQHSRRVFDARWAALAAVDPAHRTGHLHALQYLCAKWSGSHEEMFAFARDRAHRVPDGHPLVLLPLIAHQELLIIDSRWRTSELFLADLAHARQRWSDAPPQPHPRIAEDHSLMAAMLGLAKHRSEAHPHFHAMGRHASAFGWQYFTRPRPLIRRARANAALCALFTASRPRTALVPSPPNEPTSTP